MSAKARRLVVQGKKIGAIKHIRDRTGLELKDARDIVDRLGLRQAQG